jgi:hypothetical protein
MTSGAPVPRSDVSVSPAAADALERGRKLAVATDADDDDLAATRALALGLAIEHDLEVVLYDRSEETWMDHPHPSGPLTRADLGGDAAGDGERGHLVTQLTEFEEAGVTATAWVATVPSITEIVDVVRELGVDTIILPTELEHPKLLDRLKGESPAKVVERITEINLGEPVTVLVVRDGSLVVQDMPDDLD